MRCPRSCWGEWLKAIRLPVGIIAVWLLGAYMGHLMTCQPSKSTEALQAATQAQGRGEFAVAVPLWEIAIEDAKANGSVPYKHLQGLAYSAARAGDRPTALKACAEMQAIECGSSDHHFYRGLAYELTGDKKAAIDEFFLASVLGEPMATEGVDRLSKP